MTLLSLLVKDKYKDASLLPQKKQDMIYISQTWTHLQPFQALNDIDGVFSV